LKLKRAGRVVDVIVDLGPVVQASSEWTCSYRIAWPDGPKTGRASGLDAPQAIYLAMQFVAAQLYMSAAHQRGELYWDKPGNGYGYPLPVGSRDLAVGDDRKL
jgi:hypothetical protein